MNRRNIFLVASLLGILQIVGYYLAAACVNGSGPFAIAQPDTLLYCQAARRICDGHAFSFSAGTACSSGTTSVLYPFVLSVLYACGARGAALYTAGFLLNAVFYLVFLLAWSSAFHRWLDDRRAAFSVLLLALLPQPAYCAMAQSDTGLWMAASGLTAMALSGGSVWAFPLLAVAPWIRPEGLLIALAIGAFAVVERNRRGLALAATGILSVVAVFVFNRFLTGAGGFSSVANKGYFTILPFTAALDRTVTELLEMVRDVFLGQCSGCPRAFYTVPVIGGLVTVFGLFTFAWKRPLLRSPAVPVLAAAGGLAVVAQGGWQGSNFDRYLSWLLPVVVLFHAYGWSGVGAFIKRPRLAAVWLAIPILISAGASIQSFVVFHGASVDTDRMVRFARHIGEVIPKGASLAINGWCGLIYELGDRRLAHLSAMYSPEFAMRDPKSVYEILKNEPATRFDYWFRDGDQEKELEEALGRTVLIGPDGAVLRQADWSAFGASAACPNGAGLVLKDRVDVGYEKDEKRSSYEIRMKYALSPYDSVLKTSRRGETPLIEVGKMVAGYDEMTVGGLEPGKDVRIVMRTCDTVKVSRMKACGEKNDSEYAFDRNLSLTVAVDGVPVTRVRPELTPNGFSDVAFTIPGAAITADRHRIAFRGDHMAFGYWFYQ